MANNVYFTINGEEAYPVYGVYMGEGSLAELMTPPSMKQMAESECPLEDGKRIVLDDARIDGKEVTLTLYLVAPDFPTFLQRYGALCELFKGGRMDIETRFQPGVVYHCIYQSCSEFKHYDGKLGMFSLRLVEPDPSNRRP